MREGWWEPGALCCLYSRRWVASTADPANQLRAPSSTCQMSRFFYVYNLWQL